MAVTRREDYARRQHVAANDLLPLTAWLEVAEDLTDEVIDADGNTAPASTLVLLPPDTVRPSVRPGMHDVSGMSFPSGSALLVMHVDALFDQVVTEIRGYGVRELTFDERGRLRKKLSELSSKFRDFEAKQGEDGQLLPPHEMHYLPLDEGYKWGTELVISARTTVRRLSDVRHVPSSYLFIHRQSNMTISLSKSEAHGGSMIPSLAASCCDMRV